MDFEDFLRFTIRKSVSTPKSKLRSGSTSKSKRRSGTKPSCKTNLEAHPSFHGRFHPGKCPGCSRDWSSIYASPHNNAFIFPCGHLLCSVCRCLLETNSKVSCRGVKFSKSHLISQLKALSVSVLPQSIRPMPLMSLHSGSLKTFVATEPAISELRATALSSRSQLNVPTQFSSKTNGSFEEGSAVVSLLSSSKPQALSSIFWTNLKACDPLEINQISLSLGLRTTFSGF